MTGMPYTAWIPAKCSTIRHSYLAQALRVIHIYTHRWRIEEFHKAWKTGAGAERQRMEEPDNLERMVSILSFVAVRLLQPRESFTLPQPLRARGLLKNAEHVESQSAETVLTRDECQLLGYLDKGKRQRKERAGSLQWAYMAIGRLGGYGQQANLNCQLGRPLGRLGSPAK